MTAMATERPRQAVQINFNNPQATREWAISNAPERGDVVDWAVSNVPTIDTFGTLSPVILFIQKYEFKEIGGGCWELTVHYAYTPNYFELSIDTTGGSTKLLQSLSTDHAYNCATPASSTVTDFITSTLTPAVTTLTTDNTTLTTDATAMTGDISAAQTAAGVAGVDPTTLGFITTCLANLALVVTDVAGVTAAATDAISQGTALATDAAAGNAGASAADAAAISTDSTDAATASASCATDQANAQTAATAATGAAVGQNAQTIAAAAAAQTATTAAATVATDCATVASDIATLDAAAAELVSDVQADQAPGANGIPDYKGAIGVNGDQVEGVDVPIPKLVYNINKKLKLSVLSSTYCETMKNMTGSINEATFSFSWKGQTFTHGPQEVLFKGFRAKQTSDDDLDVNYILEVEDSTTSDDNVHIGQAIVEKKGWQYLWVAYRPSTSASSLVRTPAFAYVENVLKPTDFSLLAL